MSDLSIDLGDPQMVVACLNCGSRYVREVTDCASCGSGSLASRVELLAAIRAPNSNNEAHEPTSLTLVPLPEMNIELDALLVGLDADGVPHLPLDGESRIVTSPDSGDVARILVSSADVEWLRSRADDWATGDSEDDSCMEDHLSGPTALAYSSHVDEGTSIVRSRLKAAKIPFFIKREVPSYGLTLGQWGAVQFYVLVSDLERAKAALTQLQLPTRLDTLRPENVSDLEWHQTMSTEFELRSGGGLHAILSFEGSPWGRGPWSAYRAKAQTAEWSWEFKHQYGFFTRRKELVIHDPADKVIMATLHERILHSGAGSDELTDLRWSGSDWQSRMDPMIRYDECPVPSAEMSDVDEPDVRVACVRVNPRIADRPELTLLVIVGWYELAKESAVEALTPVEES